MARRCDTTHYGRSVSPLRSKCMSSSFPRTRSNPTSPNCMRPPMDISAPTACFVVNARAAATSRSTRSSSSRRMACTRFPTWRPKSTDRRGRRNAPHRAPRRAARAFSPTGRAASRKSIASRSAPKAPRVCCPRSPMWTFIVACRRAVTPRACRRICAPIRAKATSPPKSAAPISLVTSPTTSPSRRRGRRWRELPTQCRRWCRVAITAA